MSSVGRVCLYCSKPILIEEKVSVCDRCYAAHHEECWERNGRCSTFRCGGAPRTMYGGDVTTVLQTAMLRANQEPLVCPVCTNKVFAGTLQGRLIQNHDGKSVPGLLFVGASQPEGESRGFGLRLLKKALGRKSWFLPGASVKARSCGKCRRLFLWGMTMDKEETRRCQEELGERYCPHCGVRLWPGHLPLSGNGVSGKGRFECDDAPDFHQDWFGHNVLDRFFLNRWSPSIAALPAHSCPECKYTEVAGRPIYRVL